MIEQIKPPRSKLGVYVVCITELWERFGYYTVAPLLALFMTKALNYSDEATYTLYASFTALLYMTPAIGGYLADRYLGYHRSLIVGASFMATGYACVATPTEHALFYGLSLVIVGMGFFKAMPYGIMGKVLKDERSELDKSCTLYYLCIQLGGITPIVLGGFVARHLGWHVAFAFAAVGLSLGLFIFLSLHRRFKGADNKIGLSPVSPLLFSSIIVGAFAAIALVKNLINHPDATYAVVIAGSVLAILYIIVYACLSCTRSEQKRLIAALILSTAGAVFAMLYNQQPTSVMLFIDRHVDRQLFSIAIPASTYWILNAFWVVILAPSLSVLYGLLSKQQKDPSIASKFAIGVALMGLGFYTLNLCTQCADAHFHVSSWWIVACYFFLSSGELLINALGASMILQYVPEKLTGVMMGIWFLSNAGGSLLGGVLARLTAIPKNITSESLSLHIYGQAFHTFAMITLGIAVVYACLVPLLNKMTNASSSQV